MKLRLSLLLSLVAVLASCSSHDGHATVSWTSNPAFLPESTPAAETAAPRASSSNSAGVSHAQFVASSQYRMSRDFWRGPALSMHDPANSYVEILLAVQRGRLSIRNQVAMDFPICAGEGGENETPRGSFRISQKVRDYQSNLYGSFVDSSGRVVRSGACSRDKAPEGARFRGASMPYWMRFNGAVGMHVGRVYRYGASHGCVRVPVEACSILFSKLAIGSRVIVK